MNQQLVDEVLTSDSDEIKDLKSNPNVLEGFIDLIREIDALPDISKRFYEDSRSLYQTTVLGHDVIQLEKRLAKFFGPPIKPADKSLPRKLRKSSVVKYLGGIQKDQSLFTADLKTGQFYGALWPWRRNRKKIELHFGYCSDWMTDEDYLQLEDYVHQCVSHGAFEQMNANIGGQIHGISLPSFLQMAEMEKSSFTLRVTSRHRVGALYLSEGNLLAAELDDLTGCDAAYRIISWDDVSIDIEPYSASKSQDIKMPLMHILMESLKLKDEAAAPIEKPPPQPKGRFVKSSEPSKRLVRLERAPAPVTPHKKSRILTVVGVGVGIFAVIAAVAVVVFHILENRRTSDGYEALITKVENENVFENKLDLLNRYMEDNPGLDFHSDIQSRIREIHRKIEDRAFEQATLEVSGLSVDEHYEASAIKIYSRFLEQYPNSRHTEKINRSIAEIKNLLDQYYYEELKRAARLDFNKRLQAYRQYLSQFPSGKYKKDVEILINEMGETYLSYLYDEAKQCEQVKQWDSCIEHCHNFIEAYAGLELSQKAHELRAQLEDQRDYFQLVRKTNEAGKDYRNTYLQFQQYLADNPKTTQRKKIEVEMGRLRQQMNIQRQWQAVQAYATDSKKPLRTRIKTLDQYIKKNINGLYSSDAQSLLERLQQKRKINERRRQIEAQKQSEQVRIERQRQEEENRKKRVLKQRAFMESEISRSNRYRSNGDGTFTDKSTGLTWTILDSFQEKNECITYDQALEYVKSLRHGRHIGWRLPTAYELAAIIKNTPYFPVTGAKWYWSSEMAVKGYHSVVDIVTAEHGSVFKREQRALTDCGSVRAVLIAP